MFEMITGYVALDGGQTYYEEAGTGESLILVHTGFLDSRMWDRQWQAFTQRYHVIRYDMRGCGKSSVVSAPVNRRQNLHDLLDHLGISQAHFLGCSMGGAVILDYALEYPERVLSLALVSVVPGGFQLLERPHKLHDMTAAMQRRDLKTASELQLQLWLDGPFRTPAQINPGLRHEAAEMNSIPVANKTWMIADSSPLNPLDPPALKRLHEVQSPTLIMAGALDDPEVLRAADVMASTIPAAKKVLLSDCGHLPNMEKPDEFNHTVLDFLACVKEA
jgi:pimeloyl-ACP methyl ester carboxylesterase